MKRLIAAILCMLLAVNLAAIAEQTVVFTADGYEYTVSADGTAAVFRYLGSEDAPVIPRALDGHSVTGIGAAAFYSLRGISSIAIPDSIVSIAPGAFTCLNLMRLTAGAGNPAYAGIDGVLFDKAQKMLHTYPANCLDKTYEVPDNVRLIGSRAFACCVKLTSVKISDSVKGIGEAAFEGCTELKSVTLPGSITSIGRYAFSGCESLVSVVLPGGVTTIGNGMFAGCTGLVSVTIPNSVTAIAADAFAGCASLTLKVGRGSYAAKFAAGNGIPCQFPADWL